MAKKLPGRFEWSAFPSLRVDSVRLIRPLPGLNQMYAGVKITDDHLSSELISAGDKAVFLMGKAGRMGALVVVWNGYGVPEVKKMTAGERCMVLGAVVRIERDFN